MGSGVWVLLRFLGFIFITLLAAVDHLLCVSLCSRDNGSIRSNAAKVYGCYICLPNKSVGIGCSDERIAILSAAAYRLQCSGLPLITCLLQFTVCLKM